MCRDPTNSIVALKDDG